MAELPRRWLPRAAATGRLAAQLGRAAARRAVRHTAADDRALGEAMVAELDGLKGLAMKVGQVLSYMDIGLPDETTAALARLQTGARPMDLAEVAAIIEASLDIPLKDAFDDFAAVPVAAASIGQVHRARVGGHAVAVKVRYPHIRDTLAHDLANVRPIARMVALATSVDGPAIVEEMRLRLLEECDYGHEAAWQIEAAAALAGDAALRVPALVATHCADAVLTTRWVDGDPYTTLCDAPAARRDAASLTLARFPWTCLFRHSFLHTDPHPGNFVFPGDDAVVVLDWGSARRFTAADLVPFRAQLLAILDGDRARFRDALVDAGLTPRPDRFDFDIAWDLHAWLYAPYLAPHFQFDRTWWRTGRALATANKLNQRHQAMPPAWIWLYRVQWGLHAVLARLGGAGDYRAVLRDALA